jgi:hypothetical protein
MKDAFLYYTKAMAIRSVLRNTGSPSFSAYRELGIQGAKLERMATAFDKKFPLTRRLESAGLRKERGHELHRLAQQSKHVDMVASKLFEEYMHLHFHVVTPAEKKMVPKALAAVVRDMNKRVYKAAKGMRIIGPGALTNLMGVMDKLIA